MVRPNPSSHAVLAPGQSGGRIAAGLSVLAGLLWIGQAAVVAQAFGALLAGGPVHPVLSAAAFAGLGALRAILTHAAETRAQSAADASAVITNRLSGLSRRSQAASAPFTG